MKLKKLLNLSLCAILTFSLVGCTSSKEKNSNDKKIVVGATSFPAGEILEELSPLIKEKGYELEVKIFNDYILPNEALNNGEIDANLFQHEPFLDESVKSKGYDIMAGKKLYVCPANLYSYKVNSIDELKKGDTIAISNNPSAASKSLRYLQDLGLITIPNNELIGIKDIIDNPKGLEFKELDVAQIPAVLPDVTAGFVDTTFAGPAGLDASKDSIYQAPIDNKYANLLAYKTSDKNSEKIKILEEVLTSTKAKEFINKNYAEMVVPVF